MSAASTRGERQSASSTSTASPLRRLSTPCRSIPTSSVSASSSCRPGEPCLRGWPCDSLRDEATGSSMDLKDLNPAKQVFSLNPAKQVFSLFDEFREFAFKGNVIDLAVGVIIGGAFGNIVKSLVDHIILPI